MNGCWGALLLGVGAFVGAFAVSVAAAAQETPRNFSLHWTAPDECPDDAQLVHRIELWLGQDLPEAKDQALTIRVVARGSAEQGYSAKLSFISHRGNEERSLEHPSCEKLAEAIALVIALAIDPERVRLTQGAGEPASIAPEVEAAPPLVAQPVVVAPRVASTAPAAVVPDRQPAPQRHRRLLQDFRGALRGLVGAGPQPGLGAGFEAGLGWHQQRFRVDLLGRFWLPRDIALPVDVAPSASLDVGLATLGARGCWRLTPEATWRLAACGGGDLGGVSGTGAGALDGRRTRRALYGQVAGGLQLGYARARLAPEFGFELSRALARPSFGVYRDQLAQPIFRPAAWGFSLFFGLAFELRVANVDFLKSTNESAPPREQLGVSATVRTTGERDPAELMYREHFAFVWRNARRLGCSDEWVDDAVHEVFLVATRRLEEFQGRSAVRTWLFAITFRIVGRMGRDRARRQARVARYAAERPELIADAARESEAAQYLRQLLLKLSEPQRVVLILAELEGFTSQEIAETLKVPAGTVDSRLRAARLQLSRIHERERAKDERWRT